MLRIVSGINYHSMAIIVTSEENQAPSASGFSWLAEVHSTGCQEAQDFHRFGTKP